MTSLHARAAAILAGDLPPHIRDVIEELVAALSIHNHGPAVLWSRSCPACEADDPGGKRIAATIVDVAEILPAEPASPSTDSEAGQ